MVQGQYRALMPLDIEKVEIWSGVTDGIQTHVTDGQANNAT